MTELLKFMGEAPTEGLSPSVDFEALADIFQEQLAALTQAGATPVGVMSVIDRQLDIITAATQRYLFIPAASKVSSIDPHFSDALRYQRGPIVGGGEVGKMAEPSLTGVLRGTPPWTLAKHEELLELKKENEMFKTKLQQAEKELHAEAKLQTIRMGAPRWWLAWKSDGECSLLTTDSMAAIAAGVGSLTFFACRDVT